MGLLQDHADTSPAVRRRYPLQDLHRGGLARAVRAQEREHLARADLQVDAGHRLDTGMGLPQAADLDHGRPGHLPGPFRHPGGGFAADRFGGLCLAVRPGCGQVAARGRARPADAGRYAGGRRLRHSRAGFHSGRGVARWEALLAGGCGCRPPAPPVPCDALGDDDGHGGLQARPGVRQGNLLDGISLISVGSPCISCGQAQRGPAWRSISSLISVSEIGLFRKTSKASAAVATTHTMAG